jgi:peptidoglycan hydrolase-like protein with peptidoglycan-binding domain
MKILGYMISCVVALLLASGSGNANAAERRYGSFIYNSDIPNALFFLEEIKRGDNFELRKALRNHDIDTIVLASPGGSVWAGLSMAGIIYDKKLRVYVPQKGICASACSFMFFGGNERLSEGELGVHQFASSDESKTAIAVETQAQSQFTVSEIIGFLNEFETPRFVLERMFEDRAMYWFNSEEITLLNSAQFTMDLNSLSDVSNYTSEKLFDVKAEAPSNSTYSVKELISLIQKRLNEIGCFAGSADGVWGQQTNAAAVEFAKKSGLPTSADDLISETFFDALVNAREGFCSEPRFNVPETFASAYEYSCNGGPVFNDVWSISRHDKRNKVVYLRTTKGDTEELSYTETRFKTSEGMDGQFFFTEKGYVYKFTFVSKNCSQITFQPKE